MKTEKLSLQKGDSRALRTVVRSEPKKTITRSAIKTRARNHSRNKLAHQEALNCDLYSGGLWQPYCGSREIETLDSSLAKMRSYNFSRSGRAFRKPFEKRTKSSKVGFFMRVCSSTELKATKTERIFEQLVL